VWDDELASIAQKWANQCEFKHDCPDCRKVERFSVGQNLYTISSTGEAESKNWENMIDSFYEEVKDFDKNSIKPFKSNTDYGHFTQVSGSIDMTSLSHDKHNTARHLNGHLHHLMQM
ncbi:CRISP/Allergen/PR-1, partial [Araneus ventricosus]